MCGRFFLDTDIKDLIPYYRIENVAINEYKKGEMYPSQNTPIVLENQNRSLVHGKWGFYYGQGKGIVINGRSETIMDKPMFKNSYYNARCIIPANAFFEWKEVDKKKVKHSIALKENKLISFGGVYKKSLDENLNEQLTYVIITSEAEGDIKAIHSRMPLIIKDNQIDLWLNGNTSTELIGKVLKSKDIDKFTIERCIDELEKPSHDNQEQQMKMF